MPSQTFPLKRKSICFAAAAEDSSFAPTSPRRKAGRSSSRISFFVSWVSTLTIRSPTAAWCQRLRKNSTSASSGMGAAERYYCFEIVHVCDDFAPSLTTISARVIDSDELIIDPDRSCLRRFRLSDENLFFRPDEQDGQDE